MNTESILDNYCRLLKIEI